MLTTRDKTYKAIYWSLIFLCLGFLSSPTIVSLFHIVILIPIFICFKRLKPEISIPKSSWILILLFSWGLIATIGNFPTLIKPVKAFQELKFYLFGVGVIFPLIYYFDRATTFEVRRLIKITSFIIILAFINGAIKSYFKFDIVKWSYNPDFHIRTGGFSHYMRYGYASAFLFLLGLNAYLNRDYLKTLLDSTLIKSSIIISLLAVATSQTRGGLLALLVSVPFVLLRYKPRIGKALYGLGAAFFLLIIFATVTKSFSSRYLNVFQASNKVRLSQFQSALYAMKENPVLGLGANQLSYNVPKIKEKYDLHAKNYTGHAHNIFLEHGASFGVLGIVFLLVFFLIWFFEMVSIGDSFGWAMASYIIAFLVAGQVENLFDNTNSHMLFFLYSLSQAYKQTRFRALEF